eukprot:gnl/MRDRNA2_/MRDRNA2_96985_c0_seq1.p1 gnl/MRDRNA2_/MRDRNA2_96985_c0~~gnl/MRDRNA2_/MRDRNA2_96985_c0_seq1.p1  ORF type:complete len:136 (+),score=12.86 gnl/MRDRNA2_/MRDRNA2_96985_c0_seq1:77-484(+)
MRLVLLAAIAGAVTAVSDKSTRHFRDRPTYETGCKAACQAMKGDTLGVCVVNCQQCLYREGCKELEVCQTCSKDFQPQLAHKDSVHDSMPEPKKVPPIRPIKIKQEGVGLVWYVLGACLVVLLIIVVCTSKGLKA